MGCLFSQGCCGCCKKGQHTAKVKPSISNTNGKVNKGNSPITTAPGTTPFVRAAFTAQNQIDWIHDCEKELLTSLEVALQPVQGRIDHLTDHIREAKSKCSRISKHGLTLDESAALYLYTMRRSKNTVYYQLRQTLESTTDRSKLKCWLVYLKLLKNGLNRLPDVKMEVWQALSYDDRFSQQLLSDSTVFLTTLGSASPSFDVAKEHFQKEYQTKMIQVGYKNVHGKDISEYTANSYGEVLIWPGVRMKRELITQELGQNKMTCHLIGEQLFLKTTKSITPVPQSKNDDPPIKHLVCPMITCGNRCNGHHKPNHCNGFAFIDHKCAHHCVERKDCIYCKQITTNLRECNKCHVSFCEDCPKDT